MWQRQATCLHARKQESDSWMEVSPECADEQQAVRLAQRGDRAAFLQLVEAYDRRLLYFICRILGEQEAAFDVLQDVWLAVHRRLPSLKAVGAFRVWIYRIAHDTAVSELRKKYRRPLCVDDAEIADGDVDGLEKSDHEAVFDNAEMVHLGMQKLSVDHRRILTLRFLENMNVAEIAEVLSCSDGTVKSRLHYARLALLHHIEALQR
jgi:RNA polymerase sigma-70 factor (ECF subfamily)